MTELDAITKEEHLFVRDIPEPYLSAYDEMSLNRESLLASKYVGCVRCGLIFAPKSIHSWINEGQTALCPVCRVPALIPISTERFDSDFLERMQEYWILPYDDHPCFVTAQVLTLIDRLVEAVEHAEIRTQVTVPLEETVNAMAAEWDSLSKESQH